MNDLQAIEEGNAHSDETLIDGAFIEKDLGIARRSRCNYRRRGVLPPPDTNLLGKNLWRLSTYRQFKADLLARKFEMIRRLPNRYASRQDRRSQPATSGESSGSARAAQCANAE
jgi:hypothetical protein